MPTFFLASSSIFSATNSVTSRFIYFYLFVMKDIIPQRGL